MSRAFTREQSPKDDEPPERPVSGRPNYVTPNGLKQLEAAPKALTEERSARLESAIVVDHRGKSFPDARLGAIVEAADESGKKHPATAGRRCWATSRACSKPARRSSSSTTPPPVGVSLGALKKKAGPG